VTFEEYQQEAFRTAGTADLRMFALGLAGETGEVVELIKKFEYHGKDLNYGDLAKELGDVLWYLAGMATAVAYPLEEIARGNIEKLRARYPEKFTLGGGIRE
jgi:NTP pyrophosphatase (non-canonical NTP hydrolase)